MIGTIRWNFTVGLAALALTFLFSINNNVMSTTLLRSLYSFLFAFMIAFFFRWILGTAVGLKHIQHGEMMNLDHRDNSSDSLGRNIDSTSPSEDEALQLILKNNLSPTKDGETQFSPLTPPKLVSKEEIDPEELAKVLRHLSEE